MPLAPVTSVRNPEVAATVSEALGFLQSHPWCGQILDAQLAFSVAGVLAVLRVDFEPLTSDADRRVWLVAGDLPPAYLVHEANHTWQDALRGYVFEMRGWVQAVEAGYPVADLIPVSVPPTQGSAAQLASRLDFIEREFLQRAPDAFELDT